MPVLSLVLRLHRSPHGRPLVRSAAGTAAGPRRIPGSSSFSCIPACCWAGPAAGLTRPAVVGHPDLPGREPPPGPQPQPDPLEPPVGYIPSRSPSSSSSRRAAPSSQRPLLLGPRLHHPRLLPRLPKGTARQYLLLCTGFVSIGVLLSTCITPWTSWLRFLGTFWRSYRVGVWVQHISALRIRQLLKPLQV